LAVSLDPIELVPDWLVDGEVDAVDPVSLPELIVLPEGAGDPDGLVLEREELWLVSVDAMLPWSLLRLLVVVGRWQAAIVNARVEAKINALV
jgi:hypothetical protein